MRSTKIKKLCSSSLRTCLNHMVILRSQNKITDFFMILAWACPFNYQAKCLFKTVDLHTAISLSYTDFKYRIIFSQKRLIFAKLTLLYHVYVYIIFL